MDEPIPGFLCKAYLNNGTNASPTWLEIKNIKDAAQPDAAESVEVSARFSDGKKYEPGQFDQGVTFGYQYIRGTVDTVFTTLREKYLAREAVQFAFADGPIASEGTTYFKDWMKLHKMDSAEDLGGSKIYDCEAKPCVHYESGAMIERTYTTVSGE
jgi:hypothetical protein